jgi:hypothetical protein
METFDDWQARVDRWAGKRKPGEVYGEGPWEVRFAWTDDEYLYTDRFHTPERATLFCQLLIERIDPPELELKTLRAVNIITGERLPTGPMASQALAQALGLGDDDPMSKTCGTCNGSGEITIIQTGKTKTCSRCNGTGEED